MIFGIKPAKTWKTKKNQKRITNVAFTIKVILLATEEVCCDSQDADIARGGYGGGKNNFFSLIPLTTQ
jgi:hypothetical protein